MGRLAPAAPASAEPEAPGAQRCASNGWCNGHVALPGNGSRRQPEVVNGVFSHALPLGRAAQSTACLPCLRAPSRSNLNAQTIGHRSFKASQGAGSQGVLARLNSVNYLNSPTYAYSDPELFCILSMQDSNHSEGQVPQMHPISTNSDFHKFAISPHIWCRAHRGDREFVEI